jgi:hypothetical protein
MGVDGNGVRRVTQQQYNRLKTWAERRPSVALMGEFSAGKSTLMNFLIEEDLLPTRATATELPPVWLTYGRRKAHWVDSDGGAHQLDLAEIRSVPMTSRFIRIHATAEILEHCDIIDTPGISDPNLAVESWRYVAGQANMVLWCTSATQAWRETERSAWLSLPERLRRDSILVVTRADKLLTEADREKVRRRLVRETDGLFAAIVFMATHDAVQAKAELAADAETPLWAESGAAALLDSLAERFESIYELRSALLRRYRLAGEPDPEEAAMVQARRSTEVRAVQSSRAHAKHGSGGPYVLEPGAHSDEFGAYPVRPSRPEGGTARPARPDAAARAQMLDRLQAGLEGAAGAAPAAWALSGAADDPADRPEAEPSRGAWEAGDPTDLAEPAVAAFGAEAETDAEAAPPTAWEAADLADDDAEDAPAATFEVLEEADDAAAGDLVLAEADADDGAVVAALDEAAEADEPGDAFEADHADDHSEAVPGVMEAAAEELAGDVDTHEADAPVATDEEPAEAWSPQDEAEQAEHAEAAVEYTAEVMEHAPDVSEALVEAEDSVAEASHDGEMAEAGHPAEVVPVADVAATAAAALPREVALWRAVVSRHPEVAAHAPLLAVIEEFLAELHALSAPEERQPAPPKAEESGSPAWRRLA